jgi:hypothetical protein
MSAPPFSGGRNRGEIASGFGGRWARFAITTTHVTEDEEIEALSRPPDPLREVVTLPESQRTA